VMQIKRGLKKRARKLRLGAKRTGAYVYGTLRRIVGNRSGPVTEGEVRLMFETHGIPLAEKGIFGSGYNALSQYGSVLKDSFKTADEAEEYTVKFYKMRPGLVRQDGSYRKAFRKARGLRGNPMRSSFDKPTFGPGQAEYRRVDTTTMAGMKEAERLQRAGWYQAQVTPFSTTYYRRKIRKNPPMYAHGMTAHRTHGLSLKQMMKLYRLVSSGNQKAVMYARRTLGIPMSESLSQVKAVVYHHVMDLKGKI